MIRIYGIVRQSGCIALHYYVYILGIFSFVELKSIVCPGLTRLKKYTNCTIVWYTMLPLNIYA